MTVGAGLGATGHAHADDPTLEGRHRATVDLVPGGGFSYNTSQERIWSACFQ